MMNGISVSTLATPGNSRHYGAVALWKSNLKFMNKIQLNFGVDGEGMGIVFKGPNRSQRRKLRSKAAWLFEGSDKGMDANAEHSESANEDILIFFFQLDLSARVQVALNMEQYEIAQQLRNKLTEVETEIIKQREAKRGSTSSKSKAQDKAISILRLRADMQKAINGENYALAAALRDEITKLEAESLAASAKALAYENAQYVFRLGQKVRHKFFGYCAVICGMDPVCCESSSWMENANIEKLPRGPNQPFYQVLVDVHADPNLLVAYVPTSFVQNFKSME